MRATTVAWAQGAYFLATGLWSLLHIGSFQAVTGPKTDLWLVKTVGVLVAAQGVALLWSARRSRDGRIEPGLAMLAALSAMGLAGIEAWYAGIGRISPIYLADAAAELGLVLAWAAAARSGSIAPQDRRGQAA